MAGHSKWANIKHKKGAADAKRGKLFSKLIRELTVAAKGGGDPAENPRLRLAIDKAASANLPKDTMQRAIDRGSGKDGDKDNSEVLLYEGFACGGVAVLVDTMTDNKNRAVSDIRHAFTKYGGNLGTTGSVTHMFNYISEIVVQGASEDDVLELVFDNDVSNVYAEQTSDSEIAGSETNSEVVIIEAPASQHAAIINTLAGSDQKLGQDLKILSAEILWSPKEIMTISEEQQESFHKMYQLLDDIDDVQNIYCNLDTDFPD